MLRTNKSTLSLKSEKNPNPTLMNLVRDDGVPVQDDVIVVGDLIVTTVVGAEWQRQHLVGLEVVVDCDTMVLPHADGEVDSARIDSNNRTISLSSHGRRHVRARWRRVLAGVVRRSI